MKPTSLVSSCVLVLLLALLGACSGGGSTSNVPAPACQNADAFCLVGCNLGCTVSGGCTVTQIAQNQPIIFEFNDLVDPRSVTAGSISIRTANGEPPEGRLLVDRNVVRFQPEPRLVGGQTRFGFRAGETYTLTLPGRGTGETLRSQSGDELEATIICTLRISEGLVDLDGRPPEAELILPPDRTAAPVDSTIMLRFSELIDISAFQGGSTQTSPIIYQLRRTIPDPQNPGSVRCDPQFDPILIDGVPVATVLFDGDRVITEVALKPAVDLPRRVCVEVIVTEQVRDLAGVSAQRRTFRFFTEEGQVTERVIAESFPNPAGIDSRVSGGTFRSGRAVPAQVGGDGKHGSFDPTVGTTIASNVYVWDTDDTTIPAALTLLGDQDYHIQDGVFEFTDMFVPAGTTVIFRGSNPAVIRVRGQLQVEGELTVDGAAPSAGFDGSAVGAAPNATPATGQDGAMGGAAGGFGGQGGDGCEGDGDPTNHSGFNGDNMQPPAGSGYVGVSGLNGTAGRGSPVFPTSGNNSDIDFNVFNTLTGMLSAGGGGGAFLGDGEPGRATSAYTGVASDRGPNGQRGRAVGFVDRPGATSSRDHFLVGGAGGGGGGSCPNNLTANEIAANTPWHAGSGGCGGGGALALRVGGAFTLLPGGVVASRGGSGVLFDNRDHGPPAPGGGGSGGSVLVQVHQLAAVTQDGTLDVSGGEGSRLVDQQPFTGGFSRAHGGQGGFGFVRVEGNGTPTPSVLGTVEPAAAVRPESVDNLASADVDARSGFTSTWRSTREIFPPEWLYYRVRTENPNTGVETLWTDEPGPDFNPADRDDLPLRIRFQGGVVHGGASDPTGEPGPWRNYVNVNQPGNIGSDAATGVRFMIIFNHRDTMPPIEVLSVEIVYRS